MLKALFNVTGTGELFKNPTLPPRVMVPVPRGPLLTLPALSVELAPWTSIVPPLACRLNPFVKVLAELLITNVPP